MLQMVRKNSVLAFVLLLFSCERYDVAGVISSPSKTVDARFEQSMEWNNQHAEVVLPVPTDDYAFYVATDVHVAKSVAFITDFVTLERNDNDAYFSLILGDMVDEKGTFDLFYSSLMYNSDTQTRNDTLFTVVGNHDLYFNQWNDYARYFATSTYKFVVETPHHKDVYFALDSGSATLGQKQLQWLREQLLESQNTYRKRIIFTHTNFFKNDCSQLFSGNYSESELFELTDLFAQNNVDLVLTGHAHVFSESVYKNVRYLTVGALAESESVPSYLVVHCGERVTYKIRQN